MKDHIHVELPSGAIANVSPDCPPETLNALEAVAQAAKLDAEGDSCAATCSRFLVVTSDADMPEVKPVLRLLEGEEALRRHKRKWGKLKEIGYKFEVFRLIPENVIAHQPPDGSRALTVN